MPRIHSRFSISLLVMLAWVHGIEAQSPAGSPGTLRIDPLPPGAIRYGAGAKYRPAASTRQPAPATPARWTYADAPGEGAVRRVSTGSDLAVPELSPYDSAEGELPPAVGEVCGDLNCDPCAAACCPSRMPWSGGIEFTFLKPHFGDNPAFTTLESDGATFETFTETAFEYDRELAPRVWIEASQGDSLGIRATYWQFDYSARGVSGSPPANGFGSITAPTFGSVDLSTTVPNSVYSAASELNAYSIDLEATRSFLTRACGWGASAGIRYAEVEQAYGGRLRDASGASQGNVAFSHLINGFGPTVAVRAQRPFSPQVAIFGIARGSLIFGDGQTTLAAVEDEDLDTRLTTRSTSDQDDLLPISEVQVGLQWMPPCPGVWHPYLHLALEGQHWAGAGSASSTDGDLGFFGFNVAVGVNW